MAVESLAGRLPLNPSSIATAVLKRENLPRSKSEAKRLRHDGTCPAAELKQDKLQRMIEAEQAEVAELTIQGRLCCTGLSIFKTVKRVMGESFRGHGIRKGRMRVDKVARRNAAEIICNDLITLIKGDCCLSSTSPGR